jgi:hypothetical protein
MSGLTELPSTSPTSLGSTRKDLIPFKNEPHRASARLLNKFRTYLIEIGEMLGLGDGSTPGSLRAQVDELMAGGGGGSSNVLWKWNQENFIQFTGNPLPDPGFSSGASVVNAEITMTSTTSALRTAILMRADELVGMAGWWANDLVTFADMYLRWSVAYPTGLPVDGESIAYGVLYGGDAEDAIFIYDCIEFATVGPNTVIKRRIVMVNPVDALTVVLYECEIFGGYVIVSTADLRATRDDTSYAGGTGVPAGQAAVTTSAFIPAPSAAPETANGGVILFNSTVLPPGAAWATSACNRVGIAISGNWTAASGLLGGTILDFSILKVTT